MKHCESDIFLQFSIVTPIYSQTIILMSSIRSAQYLSAGKVAGTFLDSQGIMLGWAVNGGGVRSVVFYFGWQLSGSAEIAVVW
ncbi:hypothetical protein NPIL_264501 [Nephila pilipes]|uniref:Uncharacterized protein n=1 Tax=Nephila pilipes TaxID=299642 RepID=A0A8X6Q1T8_NEPPI|nr:hypothetical protein NPIL_264501 [Nephila pilipes]